MKIDVSDPGYYFSLSYVLAFTVTFAVFIFYSIKSKISIPKLLLMLTTVALFTIVGSRLTAVPLSEWGTALTSGNTGHHQDRYAVGGLIFGLAGLILCRHILNIDRALLNLYAWVAPIGLAIQKTGCFINGCCFGKPSALPWSVQYPYGTGAHFHHVAHDLTDAGAAWSLSIHPVQLYEAILLLVVSFLVWKSRKYWIKAWSTLIFSFCLFFALRFVTGFLRDPGTFGTVTAFFLGLNIQHWSLLLIACISGTALLLNEKASHPLFRVLPGKEPSLKSLALYAIILSSAILFFRSMFTGFEWLSLTIRFIPAVVILIIAVFMSAKPARVRLTTASFFIVPVCLTVLSVPPDSTGNNSARNFYRDVKSYKRLDFAASFGNFYSTTSYNPREGECGTVYTHDDYQHIYRIGGAGFSKTKVEGTSATTLGVNVFGGVNNENSLSWGWERNDFLWGVNPYIRYDLRWVGLGLGAQMGNIRWVPAGPINQTKFNRGTRFSPFLPEVLVRAGRRDIVDLQYNYGFNYPSSFPVNLHEFSIGSGFGSETNYHFSAGLGVTNYYSFPFISAEALLNKSIGLSVKYYFPGEDFYSYDTGTTIPRKGRLNFSLNYRFGFEK